MRKEISYRSDNYNPLKKKREAEGIVIALHKGVITKEKAREELNKINFVI